MAHGITPQGFIRKTRDELVSDLEIKYRSKFGNDIDLSIYSEDGIRLQMTADTLDEVWQVLEGIYYANYGHTATGINLDRVLGPLGSERQGPKNSIVDLEFFGEDDSLIKSGTISGTPSGVLFITIEAKTIISESISVKARAIESGTSGNVAANSITEILTPLTGIDSVNNPEPAIGGRVRETDTEYFNRFMEQGSEGGSSAVGIQSALNNIQSILSAIVYENETDFEDEAGRPPHSMEAVIEGGTAEEIADLFVKKWPGGIESFGEESATIIDNKGQTRTYYYNIPEEVTIYVKIEIEKDLDVWVPGSESIVKSNCIKVVGGIDTIGDVSTNYKGNGTGKNLFSWELIAAQRGLTEYNSVKVLGIKAINAFVDTESPASEDTVIISGRQKPKLITANVTVNFL